MAKKITEFEQQAAVLSADLFLAIPDQYLRCLEHPEVGDALSEAWCNALGSVMWASVELERLGNLLRAKAGITGPSPFAQMFADSAADDKSASVLAESRPETG